MSWKTIAGLAVGALALVFMGCSPLGSPIDTDLSPSYFYGKFGSGVVYCSQGNWLKLGHTKIEGADRRSFRPLAPHIAVDKHQAYYRAIPQPHVDLETFEVAERVLRDRDHIYFKGSDDLLAAVEEADVATFEYLFPEDVNPRMWARDAHRYYMYHAPLDVDTETFRFLNYGFVADQYQIYRREMSVRPVSSVSGPIEVLNDYHLQMGNRILAGGPGWGGVHDFPSIDEIREVSPAVLVINDRVFSRGEPVPEELVDAESLEGWSNSPTFARDDHRLFYVYTGLRPIEGADPESFEPMEGIGSYGRDAERVYYMFKVLEDADRETFEVVREGNQYVAQDKHGTFYMGFRR